MKEFFYRTYSTVDEISRIKCQDKPDWLITAFTEQLPFISKIWSQAIVLFVHQVTSSSSICPLTNSSLLVLDAADHYATLFHSASNQLLLRTRYNWLFIQVFLSFFLYIYIVCFISSVYTPSMLLRGVEVCRHIIIIIIIKSLVCRIVGEKRREKSDVRPGLININLQDTQVQPSQHCQHQTSSHKRSTHLLVKLLIILTTAIAFLLTS